jgi:ribosomal protein S18 acetylase RimI-like enzyme
VLTLVRVRAARVADPDGLAVLTAQASRVVTGAPSWHVAEVLALAVQRAITDALLCQRETELLVIVEDATARRLGFLSARSHTDPLSGEAHGHVSDIVVHPEAEGLGVGRQLLAAADAWAVVRGLVALTLHIFPDNRPARRLYEQGYALEWLRLRKPV